MDELQLYEERQISQSQRERPYLFTFRWQCNFLVYVKHDNKNHKNQHQAFLKEFSD